MLLWMISFQGNIPCYFHLLFLLYCSKILLIYFQVYFRFQSKFFPIEKDCVICINWWYTNQRVKSYYPYELRLLHELRVTFITRVTSYFLHTSHESLFIARVTSYFMDTSYEFLFIIKVTSWFYCTGYELLLIYELRVTVKVIECLWKSVKNADNVSGTFF